MVTRLNEKRNEKIRAKQGQTYTNRHQRKIDNPFTETVETDGTVPTFSAIPHSVPHTVHVARHNGPDRGGGHHINLVDECEQLHEILEELEFEAKAKANGGRFTASALARASKRRFVMSRRMTFFAADRAMMGGV